MVLKYMTAPEKLQEVFAEFLCRRLFNTPLVTDTSGQQVFFVALIFDWTRSLSVHKCGSVSRA